MAAPSLDAFLRQVRHFLHVQRDDGIGDGDLLCRFVHERNEEAFAVLLQRHGPMVLGVCQRLLRHPADVEDAFQATFLVLVRKAGSLNQWGSLANWLHTVARNLALRVKVRDDRRRAVEKPIDDVAETAGPGLASSCDLRPLLDEELGRLPEKYRAPMVLCYLEGKTHAEAAKHLGWTDGTVCGRLARARDLLRARLTRRGLALSAAGLATALGQSASADVPVTILDSTMKAATLVATGQTGALSAPMTALVEGGLHKMFVTKVKIAAAVLLALGVLGLSASALTRQLAFADKQPTAVAAAPGDNVKTDLAAGKPANGDVFGYTAAFDAELKKIGQITPQEFAARYPTKAQYVAKFGWDATTAKFWDDFNKDPQTIPSGKRYGRYDFRLNAAELAKFKENGFVVSERMGAASFAEMYYRIWSRDLPVYVSSDSVLHAWHRTYDAMLEELEETYLAQSLDEILAGMAAGLPAAKQDYGASLLGDSLSDADYFLTVARSLLADKQVPSQFGQEQRVADTLDKCAKLGMEEFRLFGRMRKVDFSQFKVRGHYENSELLKRYFKAMMWCGRTDMRIAGGMDKYGPLSSARELGSAVVLHDLLRRAGKMEQWQQFDLMIQTFVGKTDSATFLHLDGILAKAGIKSPAALKEAKDIEDLQAAILAGKIGMQHVRSDLYVTPYGSDKVELPRSFTLLGQKFVMDSWTTAKVVFDDILWDDDKVTRAVPSCLDIAFAAFGNDQTVPVLVERMTKGTHVFRDVARSGNRLNYQHNLAAVRNVLDAQNKAVWDENIYMNWLGTIRELSQPTTDVKYPEVMRTQAWAMKSLNTQLASWSQLRHDTILYVKQSYTTMTDCEYPAGYVEPIPHFWSRLEKMAVRAADQLEKTPYPDRPLAAKGPRQPAKAANLKELQKQQLAFLRNFAKQVATLRTIAAKELEQKEMTPEEAKFLQDTMQIASGGSGRPPQYNGWYPGLFYKGRDDSGKWDAIVADVHTWPPSDLGPGCVLTQGVGNVDLMLVAIDNGKDKMVYAGPVLSHYEFEMPGLTRKSDSEWRKDIREGKLPPRPEWTKGYLVPGVNPNAKHYTHENDAR